jgi:acyl transferase domain-containing protein/acyl carrier protein
MYGETAHDVAGQIAITGMAGRFPGAPDADSLWTLMMSRGHAVGPVPASRWDRTAQLDPEKEIPAVGGFLDDVDLFDPGFFGISPREAADIDPQQRLLLEMCWRALEDAGQRASDLAGSRTGVYIATSWHDYELLRRDRGARPTQHSVPGNAADVMPARISYFLKLRGPGMTVETGCSSSLVALDLAARALRAGDIDAAIVGAANLILTPDVTIGMTHFGALSAAGRCAAFSASADGFVRSEGVAAICLKTLQRALADGDRIHGVVVRSVVNNDGGGDSLVTPRAAGQEDLLRLAYSDGRVPLDALAYIEAHGTGTPRGDPVEAAAIGQIVGAKRASGPIRIGSVKTNIGHAEAAAGMAGLFKVLLALRHRVVPPSLHAADLSQEIPFGALNVEVARDPVPLPGDDPVYLGVNSFGWGGTNAHVVVTGPPANQRAGTGPGGGPGEEPGSGPPVLVPLSAADRDILADRAGQLRGSLPGTEAGVAAIAGTLAWHRDHFPARAAFVVREPCDLGARLDEFLARPGTDLDLPGVVAGKATAAGRIAFVFPGQGTQWPGMGRGLYRESPAFAAVIRRCAEALRPHVPRDPLAIFAGEPDGEWMSRIDMLQPALWAMSVGLAELWRAAGIEPDVVVGHSQGEISAATVAGILSYEDAAMIVAARSAITRRACGRGLMLAADLDRDAAQAIAAGLEDSISFAVHNGPTSCVLSGDREAVLLLKELLEGQGTFCRLVNVDYASHSPHMDELQGELRAAFATVTARRGQASLMSTALVRLMDGPDMDGAYWAGSLRSPVLFADAMAALLADGVTHVVEVSAHPLLTPAVQQLCAGHGGGCVALSTLRRDGDGIDNVAHALARAYVAGLEPFGGLPRNARVALPGYPLRRERHWPAESTGRADRIRGFEVNLSPAPGEQETWHGALGLHLADLPWLADHKVYDETVLPATAMLTLALNTAMARVGRLPSRLDGVVFHSPLAMGPGVVRLTAEWRDDTPGAGRFRLMSLPGEAAAWTVHATARAVCAGDGAQAPEFPGWAAGTEVSGAEFYRNCAARGLRYGAAFRGIRSLRVHPAGGQVLAEVVLGDGLRAGNRPHVLHPALWDGALQACLAVCAGDSALVPGAISSVRLLDDPDQPVNRLWSHAVRRRDGLIDLFLFTVGRAPLIAMEGVRLEPLPAGGRDEADAQRLHRLCFAPLPARPGLVPQPGRWIVSSRESKPADELSQALSAAGADVIRCTSAGDATPDLDALAAAGVVFVAPDAGDGLDAQRESLTWLTAVARSCSAAVVPPKLAVVTVAAQRADADDSPDPGAALYWGYTRVLRREHGELEPRLIDVDSSDAAWAADCTAEILSLQDVDQIALRRGRRMAGRLIRGEPQGEADPPWPVPQTSGQPFRAGTTRPGFFERVACFPLPRRRPGPGEIEIEVSAAALNFVDVMTVMGTCPDPSADPGKLGYECAGRVTAVGAGVSRVAPGDRMVACTTGALATHVTVRAGHAQPIPASMTDADAAALPQVLLTAWYGLANVGRLGSGETVLIHSAAGGVGLAAIQVARLVGARVIATAGSAPKRDYLRSLGIDSVFESRDPSWSGGVRKATGGRGADVVLNSLSGWAIPLGLDILAEGGRFIEIGKKDIYLGRTVSLDAFRKGISVSAVDMAGLMERRPERFGGLLAEVWKLVTAGRLVPLPVRGYTFAELPDALREMSHGRHIGKFVVTRPDTVRAVTALPMPNGRFRADSAYLISGGLGALGLSVAEFLASHGAGALVLIGRSAPGRAAAARIEALRKRGTRVETVRCDVSDAAAVHRAVEGARGILSPMRLRGVIHAAGVLSDATIRNLSADTVTAVLRPKVDGARNLDAACAGEPLDFFVLFSSAAALVGNAGQAAYAAANAYLDAFALARRRHGRPALSVQWGPFAAAGLAAADDSRGARLQERGMGSFPASEAWPALSRMLQRGDSLIGYVPIDVPRWLDAYPESASLTSWEWLPSAGHGGEPAARSDGEFLALCQQTSGTARTELVEAKVRELAAHVLRLDPGRIDRRASFKSLGLDSLLSLELRNRLESAFGIRLSPTLLWTYGNPGALADALCDRLPSPAEAGLAACTVTSGVMPPIVPRSRT